MASPDDPLLEDFDTFKRVQRRLYVAARSRRHTGHGLSRRRRISTMCRTAPDERLVNRGGRLIFDERDFDAIRKSAAKYVRTDSDGDSSENSMD